MAQAGLDFIWIDNEHGAMSFETDVRLARAARSAGIGSLIRVTQAESFLISRTLDTGPDGIIVPRVESKDQAELIIQAARYPPLGRRGYAQTGIYTDYAPVGASDYVRFLNEQTLVGVQIESPEGVEVAEEIASMSGIDLLIIGPMDLSFSHGLDGRYDDPVAQESIGRVLAACKRHGKPCGIASGNRAFVKRWSDQGMTFLCLDTDGTFLLRGAQEMVHAMRL